MMICGILSMQAQTPYAVLNDGTLTFYYDDDKDSREGTVYTTLSGSSSSGWFSNRSNITAAVFDASFAEYRPASTSSWFYYCTNLTSIQGLEYLNTENVTSMSSMFRGCSSLTSLDLSKFKTDQVTDMSSMFRGCSSLTSLDLSNFETKNVTSMSYMFESCSKLTSLDLSSFNTWNVTNMSYMFYSCSKLTSLDLSSFNTEMVTDMRDMFYGCSNLETIYVGEGWNTEKVTKGGSMFYRCTKIQGEDYTQYSSSATDVSAAHYGEGGYLRNIANKDAARAYAVLDGRYLTFYYDNQSETHAGTIYRTFRTDSSTGGWAADASNIVRVIFDDSFANFHGVKSTAYWFNCPNLIVMRGLANLNTENVTDMKYMFYNCNLEEIDLSNFNTGKVTDMTGMFLNCSKLTSLDVSGFNTENVTSMGDYSSINHFGMFSGCSSLTSLDLSKFKTDQVTDMSNMFYGCSGLTSLDVSSFNTQNVTSMSYMFHGCGSLTSLDLSNFETKNVTSMSNMFYYCSKLTSLDLSSFNTWNVTNMSYMFENCSKLTSLDLSSFNTEMVTDMRDMFYGCSNLETIYVGEDWITGNVDNSTSMFYSCPSLVGQDGTKYNSSYIDKTKAHYGEGGYLTYTDNRKRATVTTNAGGWASFTPEFHCQMSEGATAYIVNDINATEKKVIARSVMTMEKGSGYFVKGEPNTEYTATATGMVTTPTDGNKVVGCPTATVLDSSKSANAMYFLGVKGTTAGLYYVSGTLTIPAGKAYLQSDSPLILSAKELSIEIEGEETAIVNVNENDNYNYNESGVRKVVRNGGLMIENGNGAYGISGVRKY